MSSPELFAFHTCTTKKEVLHWTEKLRTTRADSTLAEATINVHQKQVIVTIRPILPFTMKKQQSHYA